MVRLDTKLVESNFESRKKCQLLVLCTRQLKLGWFVFYKNAKTQQLKSKQRVYFDFSQSTFFLFFRHSNLPIVHINFIKLTFKMASIEDVLAALKQNNEALEQNLKLIEALKKSQEFLERTKVSNDFSVSDI